ncbi:MAG TPA: bifunctional oligoribonuclease/PAP phosphatase NrnA [Proteobacteria bacterium]|nr:bifunctional oligoribonuclease/PAP phosphatase NrnA [Pseudomonadota bacterium]
MDSEFQRIVDVSKDLRSAVIISHENPEGDALGSSLAWAMALEQNDTKTYVYNPDGVPRNLRFLPGAQRIRSDFERLDFDPEAVFVIDCGQPMRMGDEASEKFLQHPLLINIDHHPTNPRFGRINWVEPEASSAGELIYKLIKELGREITREIALNIYVAIVVDTRSFQNANTTPDAMQICCELTERFGFKPAEVAKKVFFTQSYNRLKLLGRALSGVELFADGKIAVMTITSEMMEESGTDVEDLEGFAEELRTIEGVKVGIMLREEAKGKVKISLRSDGELDVSEYIKELGGGGHRRAAGANLDGSVDEIKKRLIEDIAERLG